MVIDTLVIASPTLFATMIYFLLVPASHLGPNFLIASSYGFLLTFGLVFLSIGAAFENIAVGAGFIYVIAFYCFSGSDAPPMAELFVLPMLLPAPIPWLYHALMESSAKQSTVGKMLLKIRVTDLNGQRISFARATIRHFSKVISVLTLFIGFLMAGWTKKNQTLHDKIAGCLVVISNN